MKKDFYESLELPVIAAPLFLISSPELVIECCKHEMNAELEHLAANNNG